MIITSIWGFFTFLADLAYCVPCAVEPRATVPCATVPPAKPHSSRVKQQVGEAGLGKPSSPCSHACFSVCDGCCCSSNDNQGTVPWSWVISSISWNCDHMTRKASSQTYETIFQNCAIFLRTDAHWIHKIKLVSLRMLILGQKPCFQNLSRNKKDLNDVTAAPFLMSFSQLPAAKKNTENGAALTSLRLIEVFLTSWRLMWSNDGVAWTSDRVTSLEQLSVAEFSGE